jgi:hypothetical protein
MFRPGRSIGKQELAELAVEIDPELAGAGYDAVGRGIGPARSSSHNDRKGRIDMPDTSRRQAVQKVIAAALAAACPISLIDVAVAQEDHGSDGKGDGRLPQDEVTLKTKDGREVKLSPNSVVGGTSSAVILDSTASGTVVLDTGQTLVLDAGRLVGGTATAKSGRNWLMFALLPAD